MTTADHYSSKVRAYLADRVNQGTLADANGLGTDENPVCGDEMTVWIRVQDGAIVNATFVARGCEPSFAAGSAVTEMMKGVEVSRALSFTEAEVEEALGGLPAVKRHCATLAVRAARNAIEDHLSSRAK